MKKKTEWICAIGVVVVAIAIASVQKKREMEEVRRCERELFMIFPKIAFEHMQKSERA